MLDACIENGVNENGLDFERFVKILNMNKLLAIAFIFVAIGFIGIIILTPPVEKVCSALVFVGGTIILGSVLISNGIIESGKDKNISAQQD